MRTGPQRCTANWPVLCSKLLLAALSLAASEAALRGLENVDTCDPDESAHCRYVCVFHNGVADCRYREHSEESGEESTMLCGRDGEICCPQNACSEPSLSCGDGLCRSCGSMDKAVCTGEVSLVA